MTINGKLVADEIHKKREEGHGAIMNSDEAAALSSYITMLEREQTAAAKRIATAVADARTKLFSKEQIDEAFDDVQESFIAMGMPREAFSLLRTGFIASIISLDWYDLDNED